jgi:mRNA interferase MazF
MMRALQFGDVLNIRLPSQNLQGHEQEGMRPAIVVGLPEQVGQPQFPEISLLH